MNASFKKNAFTTRSVNIMCFPPASLKTMVIYGFVISTVRLTAACALNCVKSAHRSFGVQHSTFSADGRVMFGTFFSLAFFSLVIHMGLCSCLFMVTYFFRCSRNVISSAAILQASARREWPFGHFVLIKCLFNRLL